ncbi:MAG: iron-sulfur cluster assembly accessory protein [archaeon]
MKKNEISKGITKDMTIGDILNAHPEAAKILAARGIHCVGCQFSPMETLEQGLQVHGLDDVAIDTAVDDINKAIEEGEINEDVEIPKDAKIDMTDAAAKKLKELIKEKGKKAFRLGIMSGGCAGFSYVMDLADEKNEGEVVIETNGVSLFVDGSSLALLNGAKIDFIDSLQGAGFRIDNPNAKSTCGCGSSFG